MSTRSERAKRRAARLRNQRIALIVVGLLILAGIGYFAWTRLAPASAPQAASTTAAPAAGSTAAAPAAQETSSAMITTASGLQYEDLVVGSGAEAQPGKAVTVHYTGWLMDGTKFDSSLDAGQPYTFTLGAGKVIAGWDEGVAGMKVGGKRVLVIPAGLAYGAGGYPPVIPANATLRFEVELLDVQ